MADVKTYEGSCHCGAVKFVATAALDSVMSCNCSICSRTGALHAMLPGSQVHVQSGRELLTDYQYGKKHAHHPFCPTCGIRPFAYGAAPDGSEVMVVNVRCLEGVDLSALHVTNVDGKSRPME